MKLYRSRRQGLSMLETVVYVSLSAVLISLTAQWFHVVFKIASKNKLRQRQHAALKRLAEDFRIDVVAATDVELQDQQAVLTEADGEQTVYLIESGQVKKMVGDPKKPSRQEVYPDLDDLRIEFVQETVPRSVSMNVFRRADQRKLEIAESQKPSDSQPDAKQDKALLQIRCAPIASAMEMVK